MNANQMMNGGSKHPPMESDLYDGVCIGLVDLGTQNTPFGTKKQMLIFFEFPTSTIEYNGETRPRNLSMKFSQSLDEKSNLRKQLISWRGRDFTKDELQDFEFKKMVGAPARLNVTQKQTKLGKTIAEISGILPLKGKHVKPSRTFYFDMNEEPTYPDVKELPDWVLAEINKSAEAMVAGMLFTKDGVQYNGNSESQDGYSGDVGNDDVPF